jgi:phosphate transport system ATP-binding protein
MESQRESEILKTRESIDMPAYPSGESGMAKLETKGLSADFGGAPVLKGVNLKFQDKSITAIMGPSGCGKTTFIRCLNRIHELTPGARVSGEVDLDGTNIYSPDVDPVAIRR